MTMGISYLYSTYCQYCAQSFGSDSMKQANVKVVASLYTDKKTALLELFTFSGLL